MHYVKRDRLNPKQFFEKTSPAYSRSGLRHKSRNKSAQFFDKTSPTYSRLGLRHKSWNKSASVRQINGWR